MSSTLLTKRPILKRVTAERGSSTELVTLGVVATITLTAFLLRLSQLDQSLYGDEVLAYHEVLGHSLGQTIHTVATGVESSPPLFFVLAWLASKLGDPTVWIRLPSLLLGTATIPLVYLVGRRAMSREAGMIAAGLLAVSPFSFYYGIEARPYATLAFFVALSTYALLRAVERRHRGWWIAYALAATAAVYTHYTAIFVIAVQAGWSLWRSRDDLRAPVLAILAGALLYAPWLPDLHGSALGVYGAYEPLNAHNVVVDLVRLIPGYPYATLHAIPTILGLAAIAACTAAGALSLIVRARRPPVRRVLAARTGSIDRALMSSPALIVALALATPIGLLLYSVVATDIWDARGLYASVPAALIVLGAIIAALPRPAWMVASAVVFGVLLSGTIRALGPEYARPPYRAVAGYLNRVAGPRNPIIIYPSLLYLNDDVLVSLRGRHWVINGMPSRWPRIPSEARLYVIVDDALDHALKVGYPHKPGFTLVGRRSYRGLSRFTVLTYQSTGSTS